MLAQNRIMAERSEAIKHTATKVQTFWLVNMALTSAAMAALLPYT
jgi:hypothetical protein